MKTSMNYVGPEKHEIMPNVLCCLVIHADILISWKVHLNIFQS